MNGTELTAGERKLLSCLLSFYREIGPAAAPAVRELHDEAGLEPWEVPEAVKGLRAKGLVEYWELQPAVRLTPAGLRLALALSEGNEA